MTNTPRCPHVINHQASVFLLFPRWRYAWMSSGVLPLATLIYTSRRLTRITPPFATWSCILTHASIASQFCLSRQPWCLCRSVFNRLLPRQQQSCLLVSHVIEALILDPQAARWELEQFELICWVFGRGHLASMSYPNFHFHVLK